MSPPVLSGCRCEEKIPFPYGESNLLVHHVFSISGPLTDLSRLTTSTFNFGKYMKQKLCQIPFFSRRLIMCASLSLREHSHFFSLTKFKA